ncbi:endonuclease [Thalassobellus suaedae]|uniref:Endonuclease n=1 Tax=Thalassobellus suaedae TaxID=3074124 RepID=A0ABY9XRD0_9FLAO|nr:endonuclease [Flavobacteriaceae bacterium HL-DH14]
MKNLFIYTLTFLCAISSFGQIQSYYNGLDLTNTGEDLFLELSTRLKSTHISIPYTSTATDTWDVLKQAEEDPNNPSNVLLIYGFDDTDGDYKTDRTRAKTETDTGGGDPGKWNREHIFAKSIANPVLLTDDPGPGTDVHNLRPADSEWNSLRSNRKFTDGSGDSKIIAGNGGWYPGDEWKGDVARAIMYMYLRYNGDGSKTSETQCFPKAIGYGNVLSADPNMIDLFLKWNAEDPVSDFEDQHNPVAEGIQGNRNPFIDNPYLATLIWGGLIAEDRWDLNDNSDTEAPSLPENLIATTIKDDEIEISWDASTDNVNVIDYLIYLDGVYLQSTSTTSTLIENLFSNTTYQITIKARDNSSNLSAASEILNVTTLQGPIVLFLEDFENCGDLNFFTYSESSTKDWICSPQYGENNSGSIGINGYQQVTLSKDWLITSNSIDFDTSSGEKLSFYTDAAYGSSTLELVYSSDYDKTDGPENFTWTAVPNVTIPLHSDGSGTEEVYTFTDIDISEITGSVYFAFKYYSNNEPTRWTVDSFEIIAGNSLAIDDFNTENSIVKAYPNPNDGSFSITVPLVEKEVVVELYSIQSQLISRKSYIVNDGIVKMNIQEKPAGLYIVKVHLESKLNDIALKVVKG